MLSNKFAGFCTKCRVRVESRKGKVIKRYGAWIVYCNQCAEKKLVSDEDLVADVAHISNMWWNQ